MKKIFLIIFIIILCTSQISAQHRFEIKTERLSDRVIVVSAVYLTIENYSTNVTAIASDEGIIVIDTANPLSNSRMIRQAIEREFGRNDFKYLINTHGHFDHVWGNQVYPETDIIAHTNTISTMNNGLEGKNDLEDDFVFTVPNITFGEDLTIDAGDITVELSYYGLHSDILVYVPEEKLLIAGDAFHETYLPVVNYEQREAFSWNIDRWISVLESFYVEGRGINKVVSGHRNVFSGEHLKEYLSYFKEVFPGVERAVRDGLTLDQTKEKMRSLIERDSFKNLNVLEECHKINIEQTWMFFTEKDK
ncbi:MAG: MBL fold metallo-hydrolase [bacterium]|nr:MBL fold metallo-hydrolase [bacterium]